MFRKPKFLIAKKKTIILITNLRIAKNPENGSAVDLASFDCLRAYTRGGQTFFARGPNLQEK
jgi:hypothetical protein